MSDTATQLQALTAELLRLSECAKANAETARTNPEQYVAAVSDHFLQLIPMVADVRKSLPAPGQQPALPREVLVEADAWAAATFIVGSREDGFNDSVLYLGEHTDDDGKVGYGLLVRSEDYPEEGCVPLAELDRPSSYALPPDLHPATADLVQRFAAALAEKLAAAEVKYGWDTHWQSPSWMEQCRQQLVDHIAKGDPRDVAAYCMFLWHHGESTALPSSEKESQHAK